MTTRRPGVFMLYLQNSYGSVDAILLQLALPGSNRVLHNVAEKAIQFLL